MKDYLMHYGIKGQKWGIRNGPPYPLKKNGLSAMAKENLKGSKSHDTLKFGSDENHNILYITGKSGTGKSTVALYFARKEDTVIHLDAYSESSRSNHTEQNSQFNRYLNKHVNDWRFIYMDKNLQKAKSKDYWQKVDEFHQAIKDYSKLQYAKGGRVIVEGVQIMDKWLAADTEFKDMPFILLTTDEETARKRAKERDANK